MGNVDVRPRHLLSRTEQRDGTGLFISRAIIERHRGRVWAEPSKGRGAAFSFSIPRELQIS
jgi:signal transduction histidine kinase